MTTHVIAFVVGFFAGMISSFLLAVLIRRHRWKNRYRPHRYLETL